MESNKPGPYMTVTLQSCAYRAKELTSECDIKFHLTKEDALQYQRRTIARAIVRHLYDAEPLVRLGLIPERYRNTELYWNDVAQEEVIELLVNCDLTNSDLDDVLQDAVLTEECDPYVDLTVVRVTGDLRLNQDGVSEPSADADSAQNLTDSR